VPFISIGVILAILYIAFKGFQGLSLNKPMEAYELAVKNPGGSFEGNLFSVFPDFAITFNKSDTLGKTLFLMNFHNKQKARNAFKAKKLSDLGKSLARTKLESERLGISPNGYLKKAKGLLEIYSSQDTIKASFSAGAMEVNLNEEKAGLFDFNSNKLVAENKTWGLSALTERRVYGTELIGYRLERESNFAEIRAFPETDESEFDQLILFSKADLWSVSKQEKACFPAFSILAKSQFESSS